MVISHPMQRRFSIRAILAHPEQRRELLVGCIQAIQNREGIPTTRAQAEAAYEAVRRGVVAARAGDSRMKTTIAAPTPLPICPHCGKGDGQHWYDCVTQRDKGTKWWK